VRAAERELEQEVGQIIGAMSFIWLAVDDEPGPTSARGFIERNSIALLSNFGRAPLDPQSGDWLGHDSDRELVRKSGLWNQRHVEEPYDPGFLDLLDRLISK
jgi:hypothetical protein